MAPIANSLTRVLVTGFGPFQGVPNNPSWGIASRLPTSLPSNIELIVYPSEVPVAYHPVINLMPSLISEHQPDLVLSMGVAEGRSYFAVEQTSQKDVYHWIQDIEGKVFTVEESDAVWGDQPTKLSTDLDLTGIVSEWQNRTQDITWPGDFEEEFGFREMGSKVDVVLLEDVMSTEDVRWSDAVGTYLCGFIYYTDMVEMGRREEGERKGKRDVAFMHVPMLKTEEELQMGVDIAVELIQSMVDSWRTG